MTTITLSLKLAKSIAGQLVFMPGRAAKRGLNELVGIINEAERKAPLLERDGGS